MIQLDEERFRKLVTLVVNGNVDEALKIHYEWIKKDIFSLKDSKRFLKYVIDRAAINNDQ